MADPRLTVGIDGLNARYMSCKIDDSTITYSATEDDGSAQVDLAVTFSADALVIETVADGEFVLGKLAKVEKDGVALVQYAGGMTLKAGDGVSSLALGKRIVGDLGAAAAEGYIREVATGTAAEMGVARGFAVDDSTLTAVCVML